MGCGGFTCSKNALSALNILYILVAFILIGVAGVGLQQAVITDISVIGGIIACGVFLLLIAIIGLIGAMKHHQVLLFFYMVILFLLFIIQFAIACACLAVTEEQQLQILETGWKYASNNTKAEVQHMRDCCGFDKSRKLPFPQCGEPGGLKPSACCKGSAAGCCTGNTTSSEVCPCDPCYPVLKDEVSQGLRASGGIGLFFSFTELTGVWLTVRYRNQKDPRANPGAFL